MTRQAPQITPAQIARNKEDREEEKDLPEMPR